MHLILSLKNFLSQIIYICGDDFKPKILKLFFFAFSLSFLEFLGLGLFVSFILSIFGTESIIFSFVPNLENFDQYKMMIILVILYTLKLILSIFFQYKIYSYLFDLHYELSKKLLTTYIKKPYTYFSDTNSSILIRNIYSEIGIFTYQIIIAFSILITDVILILSLIFLLMLSDSISTIIISFFLIFFYFIYYFISKPYVKKWGEILVRQKFFVHNDLKETFNSIKEIKIFNIENFFLKKFSKNLFKYSQSSKNQSILSQFPKFFFEYVIVLIFIFVINFFYFRDLSSEQIFSNLTLLAAASLRLMPCFARISTQTQSIMFYKPTVKILNKELTEANEFQDKYLKQKDLNINGENNLEFKNSIIVKDLQFKFSNNKELFNKINLKILKNEIIGIYGKSGEGKTTLVDIICGLIKPSSGQILIDGKYDIYSGNLKKDWLNKIGYVTQEIYLLNDTIKNNIIYGSSTFDKDRFEKAIFFSQLKDFISDLKNKEDTLVGENGINFSGGQIKRLAIARAMYRNPELIVFDETTSSLDIENEKKIFLNLNRMKINRSIIIISHNEDTLSLCDKVYKVKNKQIIQA